MLDTCRVLDRMVVYCVYAASCSLRVAPVDRTVRVDRFSSTKHASSTVRLQCDNREWHRNPVELWFVSDMSTLQVYSRVHSVDQCLRPCADDYFDDIDNDPIRLATKVQIMIRTFKCNLPRVYPVRTTPAIHLQAYSCFRHHPQPVVHRIAIVPTIGQRRFVDRCNWVLPLDEHWNRSIDVDRRWSDLHW